VTAPSQAQWGAIIRQQNSLDRQLERKIRLLMELQQERKSEAQLLESLEASSPPDPSDPPDGGPGLRQPTADPGGGAAPAASHPAATGMAQTSSCEVCDVPKGQAGTGDSIQPVPEDIVSPQGIRDPTRQAVGESAALLIWMGAVLAAVFTKIKNRGNELKDLLQRQGITEIAASKRTHFGDCPGLPSPGRSGLTRSGVGQALPLRIRAETAAIGAERSGISRIATACRPLAGAVSWERGLPARPSRCEMRAGSPRSQAFRTHKFRNSRGRASPTPTRLRSGSTDPGLQ